MIKIIQNRNIWFTISSIMIVTSIVFLVIWGINFGIDFKGGTLIEIIFNIDKIPSSNEVTNLISSSSLGQVLAQPVGEKGMVIRTKEIDEKTHQEILKKLNDTYNQSVVEQRFDSIGPSIGQELKRKSIYAVVLVCIGIIIYIAWSFRKVSKPVASWIYGVSAVIALIHDVLISCGFISLMGKVYLLEVNAAFVAAILTILGYSVNDTIVVFDRTRENIIKHSNDDFEQVVEKSVNETIVRSINTSFTVILTLFAVLVFGGESIRDFALTLIVGITVGTYSSIFLASPLLVVVSRWVNNRK